MSVMVAICIVFLVWKKIYALILSSHLKELGLNADNIFRHHLYVRNSDFVLAFAIEIMT